MTGIKVYNMKGAEVGTMDLNDSVFGVEYRESLIHQAVVTRLANERQGTQSAKTRTEVRGGGRKIYRQKGTGNARHHSNRAPQFKHGGVVFAPKPRDFSKKMNVKAKRAALLSAISKKVADGEFIVVDELKVSAPKTKEMVAFQKALGLNKTALVVMDSDDVSVVRAAANIPDLQTLPLAQLSTYEVVANNKIVMTKAAVEQFEATMIARLAGENTEEVYA